MTDRKRAAAKARALLQAHNVRAAPIDVFALAEREGIRVVRQFFEDNNISGVLVRRDDASVIGINASHHPHRQRFTLAHELAHYVLHAQHPTVYVDDMPVHFRGEGYHPAPTTEEVEANAFAAELLMPEALLRQDLKLGSIDALDEVAVRRLARKYGVSGQAVTIRLSELGLVSGFGK